MGMEGDFINDNKYTDSDLVDYVKDALRLVFAGDTEKYQQLVYVVTIDEKLSSTQEALLVTTLKALSQVVTVTDLDHDLHNLLLSAIFKMSLWKYKPDVMDAVIEFIKTLATSSGKYVDDCLEMLTGQFSPPRSLQYLLKLPHFPTRKYQVLSRVHSALEEIACLLPLSPYRLEGIVLAGLLQHSGRTSTLSLVMYVENMLKLESGVLGEVVRVQMLVGAMNFLLNLDLEIGWDDIIDDSSKGIFQMELEDVGESTDDDINDASELPRGLSRKTLRGNAFAEKLDSLMVLTFEHLESCESGGRLSEVFEILLESFRTTILTAYKSKFAQFVMFYACSLDPGNCGVTFALKLENIFYSSDATSTVRMGAVAYLASYLSRAKFLSASEVASTLERLVGWCLDYVQKHDDEINPEAHRIFYSGCQAIMYLLCFRMKSMMDVPRLKSLLVHLPLQSILNNKLNPLKVCLPSIVTEFLRQAKVAGLFMTQEKFDFHDYLESELSRAFGGMERLDTFFPFDPCLLEKCDSYIRPNFIFWSMVQPTYLDDEDSSDEDVVNALAVENENENGMDYQVLHSLEEHFDFDEFDSALNQMSITPKDSLLSRFGGAISQPVRMPSRIRPSTSPESL